MSTDRHQFKPYAESILSRSNTNYQKERFDEQRHRENDHKFSRMVLMAMWYGDNLPAGVPKPVRPLLLVG